MRWLQIFLYDPFILLLILLNALFIFISGFDIDPGTRLWLLGAENGITLLFLVELTVKLHRFRWHFFHTIWNKLDFILILLSVPALLAFFMQDHIQEYAYLLVLRVMRVFKSLRLLKFIPGVDKLVEGLKRALRASIIVMIGFLVYIFIIGTFSHHLFLDAETDYFRNPLISLYSIFKIFTIEGWFEIPEQLTNGYSREATVATYLYFMFVVLTGGILGVSLVNSIFVDAMVSDNNDELEAKIERLEAKIDRLLAQQDPDPSPGAARPFTPGPGHDPEGGREAGSHAPNQE